MTSRVTARYPPVVALLGTLTLLAWGFLWLAGRSSYARYLGHGGPTLDGFGGALVLAAIGGWLLMTIAMMLPASLPFVALFDRMTRRRRDRHVLVGALVAGYLGIWMSFGAFIYGADWLLHASLGWRAWPRANAWWIGGAVVIVAGLYQFTALKDYCLRKCRSPFGFLLSHWQADHDGVAALRLGARHGLFCLGCCWTLLLLMFAVGLGNLGLMFLLGAFMALEKNVSWGNRLSAPLGAALVAWGSLDIVAALV